MIATSDFAFQQNNPACCVICFSLNISLSPSARLPDGKLSDSANVTRVLGLGQKKVTGNPALNQRLVDSK